MKIIISILSLLFLLMPYDITSSTGKELSIITIYKPIEIIKKEYRIVDSIYIRKLKSIKLGKNIPEDNKKLLKRILPNAKNKNYEHFLYDLAVRESDGNWRDTTSGHIGLWQIGHRARTDVGYSHIKTQDFKKNPFIFPPADQLVVVERYLWLIENVYMKDYIKKYKNKKINNIPITRTGIVAASHLVGFNTVKTYLRTNGKIIGTDGLNTSLEEYLILFYDYKIKNKQGNIAGLP